MEFAEKEKRRNNTLYSAADEHKFSRAAAVHVRRRSLFVALQCILAGFGIRNGEYILEDQNSYPLLSTGLLPNKPFKGGIVLL